MLSAKFRNHTNKITDKIGSALTRTGLNPNHITITGLILLVPMLYFFYWFELIYAFIFLLLVSVMDAFDGALARVKKMKTPFGEYLDAVSDKFAEVMIFFGFALAFPGSWYLCFLGAVGSILISYCKHRADRLKIDIKSGVFERAERLIILQAGLLLYIIMDINMFFVLSIVTALSYYTVLERVFEAYKKLS